ncbi:MAG: DNA-3-methyladenine glycosylase [Myxococcota bacterium]
MSTRANSVPTSGTAPLPVEFFARDAVGVARDLIGQTVRRGPVALRITETEAYVWPPDTACHAKAGRTKRTDPLFGPPGRAYVYLCYGLHNMLNLITGREGQAQGVLVRACAPLRGLSTVRARRGGKDGPVLLDGPGKVGQALDLDTSWSHHDVTRKGGLWLAAGAPPEGVLVGTRIGIDYAEPEHRALPWRFAEAGSRWVSHRRALRPLD